MIDSAASESPDAESVIKKAAKLRDIENIEPVRLIRAARIKKPYTLALQEFNYIGILN